MGTLHQGIDMIGEILGKGSLAWTVLFGILFIVSIVCFFRGIYIYSKRSVESAYFMIFCVPVILWAFFIGAGPILGLDDGSGSISRLVIESTNLLIPALLMFHIWSQVSYRPITASVRFFWLVIPIILIVYEAFDFYDPSININLVFYGSLSLITIVWNVYFIIAIVKSYLLCFNVFYQMPKHMRRSTYQILIAITVLLLGHVISLYFSVPEYINNVILAIAYIITLSTLYKAFFIANSSNVIVTSRDFVFSSLSTLVITVSLKGNILDWNKKDRYAFSPLPDPKYKEPYIHYRKRIIGDCKAIVSPHDENILSIPGEKGESNFLFTWHEISFVNRKFGYLVEISEVTKSYAKLRFFEEIAYYDNLTALNNRNAYMAMAKEIVKEENMPLLVIVGDINNLKKVNDTQGHLLGDKLILAITGAVKEKAPENAFIARIGGDELVLLIPNAGLNEATAFISSVTEKLNTINDDDISTPSISWGYSVMYNTAEDYNDIFRTADSMMYEDKRRTKEVSISGVVPQ